MTYAMMTLMLLAVLHFIHESILAPSFRLQLRYQLFELRDRLRALKISHPREFDDKHFHYLQDSLNALIGSLSRLDVVTVAGVIAAIEREPHLKERVTARARTMDDCALQEAEGYTR